MPLYRLGDLTPSIDPSAYVHPDAVIIGNVTIGTESSVWPGAVLRGDFGAITIGARTSIQDGSILHATPFNPTVVGDDCVIGHLVHLEGCRIENGALCGSGCVVLHDAVVGARATVAAGAVVPNRMKVPAGGRAAGVPATVREGSSDPDSIKVAVEAYVYNGRRYPEELERIDDHPHPS
jgi:carbonic anhydrase/acetyltransferase-like protein (isoleucine patch superfamily)